jgi:hypothetical protein
MKVDWFSSVKVVQRRVVDGCEFVEKLLDDAVVACYFFLESSQHLSGATARL